MKYSIEEITKFELKPWEYEPVVRDMKEPAAECGRFINNAGVWENPKAAETGMATLLLTGDLMCQERLIAAKKLSADAEEYDFASSYAHAREIFTASDLTIGNLETVVDAQAPYPNEKLFIGRYVSRNGPPAYLATLRRAGFDVLTTANNHMLDTGLHGLHSTYTQLDSFGFAHTGSFIDPDEQRFVLADVNGIRVGILAYCLFCNFDAHSYVSEQGREELLNLYSKEKAERDIKALRSAGAEYIICCMHWGTELTHEVNDRQRRIAAELADAGVDYIAGSHPHVLQPYDTVTSASGKAVPVMYSMGNFLSHFKQVPRRSSIILQIKLNKTASGAIKAADSYVPCYTFVEFDKKKYITVPLTKKFRYDSTNKIADEQKTVISEIIGEKLAVCHDYDIAQPKKSALSKLKPSNIKKRLRKIKRAIVKKTSTNKATEQSGAVKADEKSYTIKMTVGSDVFLKEPTGVQNKMLTAFRTSDEFRQAYGEYLLKNHPNGNGVKSAVRAIKKYKHVDTVDIQQYKDLIIDIVYTRNTLGFYPFEYFSYGLEDKTIAERLEYLTESNIVPIYNLLNKNRGHIDTLNNKLKTYNALKPYYMREIIEVKGRDDSALFLDFCTRHDKFMLKPINSSLGKGIQMINTADYSSAEEMLDAVCSLAPCICEELIVSVASLSSLHPQSVNTVRIYTYYAEDKEPEIVYAFVKAGRGDTVVDNVGPGGMLAAVDVKSGIVCTDARDELGNVFSKHPETGVVFKGFKIEKWDELQKIAANLGKELDGMRLIGWDMALSDKGWQVVEGNAFGMLNALQIPYQRGMRKEFDEKFDLKRRRKE